jgi:hypothetical protein
MYERVACIRELGQMFFLTYVIITELLTHRKSVIYIYICTCLVYLYNYTVIQIITGFIFVKKY